jgi:beta-aspartyl-peptidase (threonine type)
MHPYAQSAIIVHGGAGDLDPGEAATSGAADAVRLEGVRRGCAAGYAVLRAGGSALDAVEAAVRVLEDDPAFNAGTGAALGAAGDVELDASIMDGESLRCGAVAVVKDVRNPISLARAVMERSGHVLLAGPGASAFAREIGVPAHANELLVTARQRARWEAARRGGRASGTGTVGAVARDARGHLAAATSTGGTSMKRPGRIGDTALVGCGTYADDALAAVSCTGDGERIIQLTLARHAADLMSRGLPAMDAARAAVALLGARVGGSGGLVVVGPRGEAGFAHNTQVMSRAWTTADGTILAALQDHSG